MKPFDIIRKLISALASCLSADGTDKDTVKQLQADNATLVGQVKGLTAQNKTDEDTLANLGAPLSDDETNHLNDLLNAAAQATPSPDAPVPVAAIPAGAPVNTAPTPTPSTDAGSASGGSSTGSTQPSESTKTGTSDTDAAATTTDPNAAPASAQ